MNDSSRAKYVKLKRDDGHFAIILLDENREEVGHGYRGPTVKRAEGDLKYWTREKQLEQLPE